MFPENLVQACFQQVATIYVPKKEKIIPPTASTDLDNTTAIMTTVAAITTEALNATNITDAPVEMVRSLEFKDGMNVLGMLCVWDDAGGGGGNGWMDGHREGEGYVGFERRGF